MNRESFSEYLEQPSKLYQLSLTELQGLVLEYPYSANLRQLLLIKAKLENHPRAGEMLQQAASRTFDRGYLFDLVERLEREGLDGLAPADRLELKELDRLDFELLPANTEVDAEVKSDAISNHHPLVEAVAREVEMETEEEDVDWLTEARAGLDDVEIMDEDGVWEVGETVDLFDPETASLFPEAVVDSAAALSAIVGSFFRDAPAGPPRPVTEFSPSSTPSPRRLADRLRGHRRLQLARLEAGLGVSAKDAATTEATVTEPRDVASETLAALLVRQGQYGKALKMYRRLSLLYPEKKTIFAALIKDLKEKL